MCDLLIRGVATYVICCPDVFTQAPDARHGAAGFGVHSLGYHCFACLLCISPFLLIVVISPRQGRLSSISRCQKLKERPQTQIIPTERSKPADTWQFFISFISFPPQKTVHSSFTSSYPVFYSFFTVDQDKYSKQQGCHSLNILLS